MTTAHAQLETVLPGLHASAPEELPFAKSLHIRAFLLEREAGNVLVYSNRLLEPGAGAERWYLNHWHEAMFLPDARPGPISVHAADRAQVAERAGEVEAFGEGHSLDGDFEAIPIPGHTPGATAYRWERDGRRFLFTGDSVYLSGGEWVAAVLDSSDRERYLESLELLRGLEFDVLVPWAATAGRPAYAETDPEDARRRLGAIAERIRAGGSR